MFTETLPCRENKILIPIGSLGVWLVVALFFLICFLRSTVAGDIWFLLLAGDYVLDHGMVPDTNFFLYTWNGQKELFGGWGFGLLAALVNRTFGLSGILYLNALLWSGVMLTGLAAARLTIGSRLLGKPAAPELIALITACTITMLAVVDRSWLRPEVTLYLFWFVGAILFEWGRRSNRLIVPQMLFPLLVWMEAWIHTAGLLLLFLPAAYALENLTASLRVKGYAFSALGKEALPWLLCMSLCVILPLLNPYGAFQVYGHLILFLNNLAPMTAWLVQELFSANDLQHLVSSAGLSEFLPTWRSTRHLLLFFLLAIIGIGVLAFGQRKVFFAALIVPLTVLAWLHIRGVGILGICLMVPLASVIYERLSKHSMTLLKSRVSRSGLFVMNTCACIAAAYASEGLKLPTNEHPLPNSTTALHDMLPSGGNVFTTHYLGAIAAWSLGRNFKVPISAHMMVLPPDVRQHYSNVVSAKPTWRSALNQYEVKAVILEPVEKNGGAYAALLPAMLYDGDWRLIAADKDALTFLELSDVEARLSADQKLVQAEVAWSLVLDNIVRYKLGEAKPALASIKRAEQSLAIIKNKSISAASRAAALEGISKD